MSTPYVPPTDLVEITLLNLGKKSQASLTQTDSAPRPEATVVALCGSAPAQPKDQTASVPERLCLRELAQAARSQAAGAAGAGPQRMSAKAQGTADSCECGHVRLCRKGIAARAACRSMWLAGGAPLARQSNHWAWLPLCRLAGWLDRLGLVRLGQFVAAQRYRLPAVGKRVGSSSS